MNKILKKYLIFILMVFVSISVASCGDLSTMFGTTTIDETTTIENTTTDEDTTTFAETTTIVETTVEVTTVAPTTIAPTTTEPITTVPETTMTTTQIETTTTYVDNSTLVLTSPSKTTYEVYDELNLSGMTVTFIDNESNSTELQPGDYTVDEVDMSTYGTKQVFVDYNGYQASFLIDVNLPTYYLSATDLTGDTLLLQLRTIINNGFDGVSYGDARYLLDNTDQDPNNASNCILVYTGNSVSGTWDNGITWNREHVWPQSALTSEASNSVTNIASDLHNLKPANPSVNSSRGNKYFDNTTTTLSFEPRDEVKGDIARIMLYMVVMYSDLTLVDSTPNLDNYEMGMFSTLLEWHEFDPVDEFEINRNEAIYGYQFNYNPFISYPNFVDLIWG